MFSQLTSKKGGGSQVNTYVSFLLLLFLCLFGHNFVWRIHYDGSNRSNKINLKYLGVLAIQDHEFENQEFLFIF